MKSCDILMPAFNLEVKRMRGNTEGKTCSLFQLEKMDLTSLALLYQKRPRFKKAVKLMDKICSQRDSEDIDLINCKFLIDAYSRQDAYSTMLYIVHRLNKSKLCKCFRIYKGSSSDLNIMGESSMQDIHEMNNDTAATDEKKKISDVPVHGRQQGETEAVFFMNASNEQGSLDFSALPSFGRLNELSNKIVFLINIIPDINCKKNSNCSVFFDPKNSKNTSFECALHGFKHIETGNLKVEEMASLLLKYISSKGFKYYLPGKIAERAIINFRRSLSYPVRELDIKIIGDAVISSHEVNRSDPSDKVIREAAFNILLESKKEKVVKKTVPAQDPWRELDEIIGMEDIKTEIRNIVNRLKLEDKRREMGLPGTGINMNAVFLGSPGTNKTSVARLLARILAFEKIIPSANFKECGKEDLVGQYVGWTAVKVKELFNSVSLNGASGGVLFIDEAYSITDSQTSFDREAVNTLVQCMENFRNKIMVIFGGYRQRMLEFMGKNEGLRSRISFVLEFKSYSNEELLEITKYQASLSGFEIEEGCEGEVINYFDALKDIRGDSFGNGREARTLYEFASLELSTRLSLKSRLSKEDMILITRDDMNKAITKALQREKSIARDSITKRAIGFYA